VLIFDRGRKYTRPDVKAKAGLSRAAKGGNWDTGVVEHEDQFIIFTNVGTEGRTGHNYGNRWEQGCLRWYHKEGSHLGWPSVQKLLETGCTVHIFWRTSNAAAFEYAGTARAVEVADTSPVEILWSFEASPLAEPKPPVQSPEQLTQGEYREGAVHQVLVNAYERDRAARQACISHYGLACVVCGLEFDDRYGPLGAGFIHVHHIVPLSELGADYRLDPVQDLRPVCPNCHTMLHRQRPPLSVEGLRMALREQFPVVNSTAKTLPND
jgi:5-methylcytosine-specific restriction protein A